MTKNSTIRAFAALALVCNSGLVPADDIDIYSQNTTITPDAPNVLILLDNTANWSQSFAGGTKFSAEMTALQTVVNQLKVQFNLGIEMFTETGGGNSGPDGGYVRFAIQGMTDSSGNATAARNCLLKMVGSGANCASTNTYYSLLDVNNDKSNGGKAGVAMSESYDYFKGSNAYAGTNKTKADPLAFTSGTIAGPQYKTPLASSCQKNFLIVINNGPFSDNSSDTGTAMTQLGSASCDQTVINPPDTSSSNNAGDEWARCLYKTDLNGDSSGNPNVITYALEVGPSTTGQGPYNTSLLQSMGRQGKGGYYSASDASTLLAALTRIFNDINAQNSVFASSSLPLSADNSGSFLNQVYMGVFRPDSQSRPRWYGNLKQYQFALDANSNLFLADRTGTAAASASTGFAQPDAISFWTSLDDNYTYTTTSPPSTPYTSTPDSAPTYTSNPGTGGFWFFDSKGSGGSYDSADGEWVEKGGAAQQLRLAYLGYGTSKAGANRGSIGTSSATGRKVYTCLGTCLTTPGTALVGTAGANTTFDTSNTLITGTLLGTVDATVTSITSAATKSASALSAGTSAAITSYNHNTSTVTTASTHPFAVGDSVIIAGTSSNTLNSTTPYIITAVTSTTFTIQNGTNQDATGGTATKPTTTATATVSAHGFTVGQLVTVAGATPSTFNGVWTVASVPTANTFTYQLSTAVGQAATGTITATSNVATAAATAHGLTTGQSVTISGATPSGYNGTYTVTVVDANTFTYSYATSAPLAPATGSITATANGGRTGLINWARGMDTQDENGDSRTTDVRASIHGDVLHSRPVVLNYSSNSTDNNVYLFYGGNDGVFRAIKGGQASTDGVEQWAFIPQEFLGKLARLYSDSPQVLYSSTPSGITPTPTKRDYFWDGPVGSYIQRDSTGVVTKAYLFIAVRRGGRFIYALDVTSPTSPKLLWRKGCPNLNNNDGCDAGYAELGQTWSQPQVGTVKANTNPVLIFGAGYDPNSEDTEPPAASDTMGRGVFVVDAFTGAAWWAGNSANNPDLAVSGMNFSIAADTLTIDRNLDGLIDRVYAADVGGNIWRLDMGDADKANWQAWKIAALASRSTTASSRKFLFGVDAVPGSAFDAILIGSGDREHPLATNTANNVINRFYMIEDTNTGLTGANLGVTDSCGSNTNTTPVCTNLFDATNSSAVPADAKGWLITLSAGEQVVNSPLVAAGTVFFGTNQPDPSNTSCSANLGIARRYQVSFVNGEATNFTDADGNSVRSELAVGGGFLPSPVSGVVEIGGEKFPFVTDNPLNPGGAFSPTITVPTKRYRTYWHQILE